MMFKTLSAVVVAAALAGVNAQDATTSAPVTIPSDISPCIVTCISQASAANGCSGLTDVSCFCSNTQFQQAALSCLESSCSAAEVQAAESLQSSECAAASSAGSSVASGATSSGTSAATATSSGTDATDSATSALSSLTSSLSSALSSITSAESSLTNSRTTATAITNTNSPTTGTPAATNSNAAGSMFKASFGTSTGGMIGVGVALAGVVLGAGLVL